MKKVMVVLCIMAVFCFLSGRVSAALYNFNDYEPTDKWVDSQYGYPTHWVYLDFPNSPGGTYDNGVFEYDDYAPSYVEYFDITLHGYGDNSDKNIDLFLDFDSDHSSYIIPTQPPGYNVDNTIPFSLTMDIKNSQLWYTNKFTSTTIDVGDVINADL